MYITHRTGVSSLRFDVLAALQASFATFIFFPFCLPLSPRLLQLRRPLGLGQLVYAVPVVHAEDTVEQQPYLPIVFAWFPPRLHAEMQSRESQVHSQAIHAHCATGQADVLEYSKGARTCGQSQSTQTSFSVPLIVVGR